ncbi:MAG TPA: DNA-formamidopyrimidine glycosylase family protein [Kofleriaceae bacterium]|nr:DNA-formamidopyrimidine glycosylase family protein [Kofleriaceae bacterium]
MPEGDSIKRIAMQLAPLVGQTLERVTTQGIERDLAGRTITEVHPHGKHLMIDLDDGTQLRAHLGMNGRVRRYSREDGEALIARMSPGRLSLVLVTASLVVMWISAPTIEIAARRAPMRGLAVASLGPDVLADGFDPQLAASRAHVHSARTIADVLLDQRVAAGIGNIWKTESLFACGIDPRTPIGALTIDAIARVYASARELMLANLAPGGPRNRFAIYSRTNHPCPRCSTLIMAYQLGDPPRWTWSCPHCQPRGGVRGVSS